MTRPARPPRPPGPKNAIWQMLKYVRDPDRWVLALRERYGETFSAPTLMGTIVVVSTAESIKSIFGADPDTFVPFGVDAMTPILGAGSLLLQSGPAHKRARRML